MGMKAKGVVVMCHERKRKGKRGAGYVSPITAGMTEGKAETGGRGGRQEGRPGREAGAGGRDLRGA